MDGNISSLQKGIDLVCTLDTLFNWASETHFTPQISYLWQSAWIILCCIVWRMWNEFIFDGKQANIHFCLRALWNSIKEMDNHKCGWTRNSIVKLSILSNLGLITRRPTTPKIIRVYWTPPLIGWVKGNTVAYVTGATGEAGCRGIYRDN